MMTKTEKIEYIAKNYTKAMHSAAMRVLGDFHEAEDACQETMIRLYKVVDHIEDVTSESAKAYCMVTVRNTARDIIRRNCRQTPVEDIFEDAEEAAVYDEYPSDTEDMLKDIDELPEKYKNIVKLRCLEQKSAEETAKVLQISVNTVNTQLLRARKLLRNKWVSAAGVTCMVAVLVSVFLYTNVFNPPVLNETQLVEEGEPKMEVVDEELAEEMRNESNGGLTDLPIYEEMKEQALKLVPGSGLENITKFNLIEESENTFYFDVTISYEENEYKIRLDIDGKAVKYEVNGQETEIPDIE